MTSGVALIGASAIALSPIVVAPQQVHLPAIPVSSLATTLTASVNPISEWAKVLTTTFNNVSALGQQVWADPAPILKQIIINQLGYANTVATDLGAAGNSFVTAVKALPPAFQQAAQDLAAGHISGGLNTAFQAMLNLVISPGFALLQGQMLNIPGQVMQHITDVVKLGPAILVSAGFSMLGMVNGVQRAVGDTAQAVYDGVHTGNFGAALNAIVNAPAVLANAFLNGYSPEAGLWGVLTPGSGLLPVLVVSVRQAIAQALGAPVPSAAKVADAGPSAIPSAALPVASVTLGAEKVTTPDGTKVAATKTSETKTTPAEPAATAPAATGPGATGPGAGGPASTSPETPSTATETKPESGTSGEPTKPTKPSGSTGSQTSSGDTTTPNGGTGTTGGSTAGAPGTSGEPTKPTKPSGSTGSQTGSGSTTTPNGGTSTSSGTTSGTKTGMPGEPTKPKKSKKPSGSTGSRTGSGSTGSGGSGASGSGSGASASGGGTSHAAA